MNVNLSLLPDELILQIAYRLPVNDIIAFCRTDRRFSNVCRDWHFWSMLANEDFEFPQEDFYTDKLDPVSRYLQIKDLLDDIDGNFYDAIQKGDTDVVKILLHYTDAGKDGNEALIEASRKGYLDIVNLLLEDPWVDPSTNSSGTIALSAASSEGKIDVVKRLLADDRVDPNGDGLGIEGLEAPIVYASLNGYYDIVKTLLDDSRVDPAIEDNQAIIDAAEKGYHDIVKLLMSDTRVDPSSQNNLAILLAGEFNNVETFELLLTDARVNPNVHNYNVLRLTDSPTIRKLILNDYRTNLNNAILAAVRFCCPDLLDVLLNDPRFNPGPNSIELFKEAARYPVILNKLINNQKLINVLSYNVNK